MQFTLDLSSLVGVAALITVIAQWVDNKWKLVEWPARIRTWVIGILLAILGMLFKVGIFVDPYWLINVLLGFFSALIANLGYDKIVYIKIFLEAIKLRVPVGNLPPEITTVAPPVPPNDIETDLGIRIIK